MKGGLLDFIFLNLEVKRLNRQEVKAYLTYLNEIITPEMAAPDQVNFMAVKVKLNKRLLQLGRKQAKSIILSGSQEVMLPGINLL